MIEGNKFKLRHGKSSTDSKETNKIEGGQALKEVLEGETVASPSLEMPKT